MWLWSSNKIHTFSFLAIYYVYILLLIWGYFLKNAIFPDSTNSCLLQKLTLNFKVQVNTKCQPFQLPQKTWNLCQTKLHSVIKKSHRDYWKSFRCTYLYNLFATYLNSVIILLLLNIIQMTFVLRSSKVLKVAMILIMLY